VEHSRKPTVGAAAPLRAEELYQSCDADLPAFDTTEDLPNLKGPLGQDRALSAVDLGFRIQAPGYNLFLLGPRSVDKRALVTQVLAELPPAAEPLSDWCYINNFELSHKPRLLKLPRGRGAELRDAMSKLVADLQLSIPAAFESTEYRRRRAEFAAELHSRGGRALEELQKEAAAQGMLVLQTPHGFAIVPQREGKPIPDDELVHLSEEDAARIQKAMEALTPRLEALVEQFPIWFKEHRDREERLKREVAMAAVGMQIEALRKQFEALPAVLSYLEEVQEDLVENAQHFLHAEQEHKVIPFFIAQEFEPFSVRYQVNVLVDNSGTEAVPVVYEGSPTYANLVGHIDHRSHLGALVTDFTLVRPGALHRAIGGYLVVDAERVLLQPYGWQALKRALLEGVIRIESLGELLGLVGTVSLEPEPVPLDVKVVLLGDRLLYYLLYELDPDFAELFKVPADFHDDIERSSDAVKSYAGLLATLVRKEKLIPFRRDAVARVIEHGSRLAGDARKLSLHTRTVVDLLREAAFWATEAGQEQVRKEDVQTAIEHQILRLSRVQELTLDAIRRDVLLIDTLGAAIGQANGISVYELGGLTFGSPVRITATVRLGRGEVIDIQREVELGGPIHSKGVMALAALLGSRFAGELPLSLSATVVFEQTYGSVEGDSASVAEACALLSALAGTPLRQGLAVTGSINQFGRVQAVGGVNQKIEGFFDLCQARGLSGEQGVLVPADNVQHLMLRPDVVQAAAEGRFHVYPIETVDQAITLLTGIEAGEREYAGEYPAGSVNQRVAERLADLARIRREFTAAEGAQL
jgi:lon-related putative ATP-dependent protease